jgi:hypothetical protein
MQIQDVRVSSTQYICDVLIIFTGILLTWDNLNFIKEAWSVS